MLDSLSKPNVSSITMNSTKEYYEFWTENWSTKLAWEEVSEETKEWWEESFKILKTKPSNETTSP